MSPTTSANSKETQAPKSTNIRYFIGYLIKGEAATWHINLTKNISEKFNTWKLYEKLPPHITIFYPFETEDINQIKTFLNVWTKNHPTPGNFVMSGFDHFDDRVVFANIEVDQRVRRIVEELRNDLRQIIAPSSREDSLPWHPHATLASKVTPQEIARIREYVLTLGKPLCTLAFDAITIFRFEGDRTWIVDESFSLQK